MSGPEVAPYGSWKSPIEAEHIATGMLGLGEIEAGCGCVYWVELRPAEGGRYVIVRWTPQGTTDVIAPPFNARTRVHEYGGGSCLAVGDAVIFANFDDQRLYRAVPGRTPQPVTPESAMRYADGVVDAGRNRLVCVREDHTHGGEPINAIVAIDLTTGGTGAVLAGGNDFYASPRISPDGTALAWLTWRHPTMPWDAAELFVAGMLPDGSLGSPVHVAGASDESIVQPEWSPDGTLHFVSDRSNWWNLYRLRDGHVEAVAAMEAEFAGPQWRFRPSTYAFDGAGGIVCAYRR
ncbi:MAG: TolB-like translocation protein, partial [Planctomycetota bacterium]